MVVWRPPFSASYFSKAMLHLSSSTTYYLYREATNMRCSFDSLSGLIQNHLGKSALTGDIFIFLNKRRNQIKLLLWEGDGFCLYHKRLEKGTFELPLCSDQPKALTITSEQLLLILKGISLKHIRKRKRYEHPNNLP
jgi:transposase